ncbi:MAG: RDD family protein [Saprospiraceae bacterium]|nr:RDD family protein [Saprospiraceae bacterium]
MTSNILLARIIASIADLLLIIVYAFILFGISKIFIADNPDEELLNPIFAQIIGFLTLTLPVFLFSCIAELSEWKATPGKKLCKLVVISESPDRKQSIFIRNLLKYLPWELAHTGVHGLMYHHRIGETTPAWVWFFLIMPQILVFIYFLSLILNKGQQSMYDKIAGIHIESKA